MKQKTHTTEHVIRNKGFTLIELIVVIFILVTIGTVIIANFRKGEKSRRVAIASDTVINALRNAQNLTLTGRATNNPNAACRVPRYYMLQLDYTSTLTLWAYNNCGTNASGQPGYDQIETYNLPVSTRIKANSLILDGVTATSFMSFIFNPPFAVVKGYKDWGPTANFTTGTITVEATDSSVSKIITVDGVSGRIGE